MRSCPASACEGMGPFAGPRARPPQLGPKLPPVSLSDIELPTQVCHVLFRLLRAGPTVHNIPKPGDSALPLRYLPHPAITVAEPTS